MPQPGECAVSILASSPNQVLDHVLCFLNEELPAHISGLSLEPSKGQPYQVLATVFVDYIPIELEVCTYAGHDTTVAVFKHPSQSDVLRFRRVVERLITSLCASSLQVNSAPHQATATSIRMIDGGFEDDMSDDEETTWSERVTHVNDMMSSSDAALHEEAVQELARWAASEAVKKAAVATVFVKLYLQGTLSVSTTTPLAEMYPVAAALKQLSNGLSSESNDILSDSALFAALEKMDLRGFAPLITCELEVTVKSLRVWKAFSKKFPPLSAHDEFPSHST